MTVRFERALPGGGYDIYRGDENIGTLKYSPVHQDWCIWLRHPDNDEKFVMAPTQHEATRGNPAATWRARRWARRYLAKR